MDQHDGIRVSIRNNRQVNNRQATIERSLSPISPTRWSVFSSENESSNEYSFFQPIFIPTVMNTIRLPNYNSFHEPEYSFIQNGMFEHSLDRINRELDVEEVIFNGDIESSCSICCCELETNDKMIELDCAHRFHSKCLNEWGKYKPECPNCRASIPVKGVDHSFGELSF